MEGKTCCVTGHRNIPAEKIEYVKSELRKEIVRAIKDGYTHFLSGFAEGVDLLFAAIVVELKVKNPGLTLEAAIPYRNRMKAHNKEFQRLIGQCSAVGIHCEEYSPTCYINRNRFMVQQSERVIAVFDGREKGGTLFTMRYAYTQDKDVVVIKI